MKLLCVDLETTTYSNGSSFDNRNFVVCVAYYDGTTARVFRPDDKDARSKFEDDLRAADTILGFNFKFDLHWLTRLGFELRNKRLRDAQVIEYILQRQNLRLPSLNAVASRRINKSKVDVIKEQYWNVGINTDAIPWDILVEYAANDVVITWEVYQDQLKDIRPHQQALISLACQDLVVLHDMERAGLRFDRQASLDHAEKLEKQIAQIQESLSIYHNVPCFNWNSPRHISALLFGGTITDSIKVPDGVYGPKAAKAGQIKYKVETREYHLPQLLKPPKGSETQTQGVYSVEEDVLKTVSTKKHAKLLESILEIKKLNKEISTYLRGIPAQQDEQHSGHEFVYGQFNQTITRTGRLSSIKPNLQNLSENALKYFISRYEA